MSILDDNIFKNTDLVEISNKGFPDTQLLNEYLNNYPHGSRNVHRIGELYARFNYVNKQWFLINSKIRDFANISGFYIAGISTYTKYNNISVRDKYFGFGWNNYFDILLCENEQNFPHSWNISTLFGEYSTYKEAVNDSYKLLTYIKNNPEYALILYNKIDYNGVPGYRSADKLINYIKEHYEFIR